MSRFSLPIFITALFFLSTSAQQWNIYNQSWTLNTTWTNNVASPFYLGSCCLPASNSLKIVSTGGEKFAFTTIFSTNANCGTGAGNTYTITADDFGGNIAPLKGGPFGSSSLIYWPHNDSLMVKISSCDWLYVNPNSQSTSGNTSYNVSGGWQLATTWSRYQGNPCCWPLNNQFGISQNNVLATLNLSFSLDNAWCVLFWQNPLVDLINIDMTGGGGIQAVTDNFVLTYFQNNASLGMFYDDCAEYYVPGCSNGYYFDQPTTTCLACSSQCLTCSGFSYCNTCNPGYLYIGNGNCSQAGFLVIVIIPTVVGGIVLVALVFYLIKKPVPKKPNQSPYTAVYVDSHRAVTADNSHDSAENKYIIKK